MMCSHCVHTAISSEQLYRHYSNTYIAELVKPENGSSVAMLLIIAIVPKSPDWKGIYRWRLNALANVR